MGSFVIQSWGAYAQKVEGVWQIGKSGLGHFFEPGVVGERRDSAMAKAVLAEMGVGDKIPAIQAELKASRERAEAEYRAKVRDFVEALGRAPAYCCLSSDMQQRVEALPNSYGVPDPAEIADELQAEWAKAEALSRRKERGEILVNFGGHFRVMGVTGQAQYWVVRPDGALREPDGVGYRKRYTSEGEKCWRLVGPEELALTWSKAFTAADHVFCVAKLPVEECTADQLTTIERLECSIDERFAFTTGMSGNRTCPSVGKGWGLRKKFGK